MASSKGGMDLSDLKKRLGLNQPGGADAAPDAAPPTGGAPAAEDASLGDAPTAAVGAAPVGAAPVGAPPGGGFGASPGGSPPGGGFGAPPGGSPPGGGFGAPPGGSPPGGGFGAPPGGTPPGQQAEAPQAAAPEPEYDDYEDDADIAYDYEAPPPPEFDANAVDPSIKAPGSKSRFVVLFVMFIAIAALSYGVGNAMKEASQGKAFINSRIDIAKELYATLDTKKQNMEAFRAKFKKFGEGADAYKYSEDNHKELIDLYAKFVEDKKKSFVFPLGQIKFEALYLRGTEDESSAALAQIMKYGRSTMLLQAQLEQHISLVGHEKRGGGYELSPDNLAEVQKIAELMSYGQDKIDPKAKEPKERSVVFALTPAPGSNPVAGWKNLDYVKKVYPFHEKVAETEDAKREVKEYYEKLKTIVASAGAPSETNERGTKLSKYLHTYKTVHYAQLKAEASFAADFPADGISEPKILDTIRDEINQVMEKGKKSKIAKLKYGLVPGRMNQSAKIVETKGGQSFLLGIDKPSFIVRKTILGASSLNAYSRYAGRMKQIDDLLKEAEGAAGSALKHLKKQKDEQPE